MRRVLTAVCLACLLAACGKPGTPGPAGAASSAAATLIVAPEDIVTVQSSAIAGGPVITGSIQPERRADLAAEVAAVVVQVLKDNGEAVRRGDLLMRLDDTALRESQTSADESVRAATQAYEQAERQVQRLKTLQQQGMISTQALEDAEIRRNTTQSELVAARARAVSARQQVTRTLVRAPFDGVVSERRVSVGDTVQIGRELVKVIDPTSMRFEGLVSADRVAELKTGQTVRFRVNGYGNEEFAGRVRRIDAAANATTRQVALIVDFADAAKAPRVAGLFAEGRVETGSSDRLTLPESPIVRSGEAAAVWRLDGKTLQRVAVKLGERDERSGLYPVLAGLAAGDRVLRNPSRTLAPGQAYELGAAASAAAASAAK
ncbi:RND family efflux transporter MFP subunit [Rubrivivax gelatinosus]|uniref:efflux RND transporter periplasmic adaptor subunit n=2 Tax=Rubrivivax gelatinosus TaxID=28068 RepID=UPI0018C9CAD0|nr:efflux RND transporter periplasmic adaptor subunit [Rubrivivax gelatinosus]MBG6082059.1 RND family efflux transporter MFP subunit [Rubrivivax gelatinosus]